MSYTKIIFMTATDKAYMNALSIKFSPSKNAQERFKEGYIAAFELQAIKIEKLLAEIAELRAKLKLEK